MSLDRYRAFAGYNAWANARLYDACAALPESEWARDRGAFFGSLQGTLNHLLVTDRIWLRRLTGEGETYDRLDAVPYAEFKALRAARVAEDARITAWVDGLADVDLTAPRRYRTMAGDTFEQPLATLLDHLFNHQTHHRGQAHALISAAGGAAPSLDLLVFQRASGLVKAVQSPTERL